MNREPTCNMLRPELEREVNELREGGCRFNCRTAKDNFIAGWHAGADDPDSFRVNADMEAWKEYQQEEYTLESEIGFIKETPDEL